MAAVYLDADVAVALAELLRAAGHDAVARDSAQMLAAWRRGRVVITHNGKDFPDHHEAWQTWPAAWGVATPRHPGVIVVAQVGEEKLATILSTFFADGHATADRLYRWRPSDGWSIWQIGGEWTHAE